MKAIRMLATKVKTFIGLKAQTLMHIAIQEFLNPSLWVGLPWASTQYHIQTCWNTSYHAIPATTYNTSCHMNYHATRFGI